MTTSCRQFEEGETVGAGPSATARFLRAGKCLRVRRPITSTYTRFSNTAQAMRKSTNIAREVDQIHSRLSQIRNSSSLRTGALKGVQKSPRKRFVPRPTWVCTESNKNPKNPLTVDKIRRSLRCNICYYFPCLLRDWEAAPQALPAGSVRGLRFLKQQNSRRSEGRNDAELAGSK